MYEADTTNELQEVEVCDVLGHALVSLDLVEQVAALGELHGYPAPDGILTGSEPLDDVWVLPNVGVEGDLHGDLLCGDAAMFDGVGLVDELDGEDGRGLGQRDGLPDAVGVGQM